MVMKNKKALERWKRLRTLIIDESEYFKITMVLTGWIFTIDVVSMVDGTFFDKHVPIVLEHVHICSCIPS